MTHLPKGYPDKLKNTEIESEISKLQSTVESASVKSLLQSHFAAIDIGLTELERRRGRKATNIALSLSTFSIFFAAVAIYFSFVDFSGDKAWQNEQIKALSEINATLRNFTTQ